MSRIQFKKKPRKDGSNTLFTDKHGTNVWVGKDYALQNEVDEAKRKTWSRSCFRGCRTCGACANSKRDNFQARPIEIQKDGSLKLHSPTESYDYNSGEWIDCRSCEPFRFHDCHNGVFRDTRQDAEPFTEEAEKLIKQSGGKPLI